MTEPANGRPVRPTSRALWTTVVVVSAVVANLALQLSPLILRGTLELASFRDFYSFDQWGYLAIVRNVIDGVPSTLEPDTETGTNYYPHAYYLLLGLIARLFAWDPITAWNIVGLVLQSALVGTLAYVMIRLSRRIWAGLFAPMPFVAGTFSWLLGGSWFLTLDSHAVLWGPFAVLHTLNGEAAALCVAGMAMLWLIVVWVEPTSERTKLIVTTVVAAVIGALANVQTYSFITASYMVLYVAALWVILARRDVVVGIASALLVPVVFIAGPSVNELGGQLATLVFGLIPVIPAVIRFFISTRGRAVIPAVAFVLAALPQVIHTVNGLVSGDPFLSYRVASNVDLGVDADAAVLGALAVIVPILLVVVAGVLRRRVMWIAYGTGMLVAGILLSTNDLWGANAEPYRIWIDVVFFAAVTAAAMSAQVGAEMVDRAAEGSRRANTLVVSAAAVVVVALAVASSNDFVQFVRDDSVHNVVALDTPRDRAILDAVEGIPMPGEPVADELTVADTCIDMKRLKVLTGIPIANYHLGMAWPERYEEVWDVYADRYGAEIDQGHAIEAGVRWVLTDSACGDGWEQTGGLRPIRSVEYSDASTGQVGAITLWELGND